MRQSDSPPAAPSLRRDGWTIRRQLAFLDALARTRSVTKAARAAGMSRESAYRLRRRPSAALFAAAWDRALQGRASRPRKQPSPSPSKGHRSVSLGWRRMVGEVTELPLTSTKGHKMEEPLFSPMAPSKS
jgi:hypothetical protein